MNRSGPILPSLSRSLSARLLLFTIVFVMISEVLIYVPSIARFRVVYLEERLANAHIATLALEAAPGNEVADALQQELLTSARAHAVILKRPDSRHMILRAQGPVAVDAIFDLRLVTPLDAILDSFDTLWPAHTGSGPGGERLIRIIGPLKDQPGATLEVILDEQPLRAAMYDYSVRILRVSIIISVLTACLVYAALQWLMVRPIRRITRSMVRFREAPEDASRTIAPSGRTDEIGTAQRALSEMQKDLRAALTQKEHLAALGTAMNKINHDLRNLLASAQLVSDRLADSDDPVVREVTPTLVSAIDRAIALCTETLRFGRAEYDAPRRLLFPLDSLVPDLTRAAALPAGGNIRLSMEIDPGLDVDGDPDHIFRVLLNLMRNSVQAIEGMKKNGGHGEVRVSAGRRDGNSVIEVSDNGPGLPPEAREHLFQPFVGAGRGGGRGLGLSIARELVRAHGGDIELVYSGGDGAIFRISIPDT